MVQPTAVLQASFEEDLAAAVAYHGHLCTGQIIGVRMARRGLAELNITAPHTFRDLFVFVEIDRCLADAISTVTGCKPGKRRFSLIDYGKSAASFVNNATGEAVRVASKGWITVAKDEHLVDFFNRIPDEELFSVQKIKLSIPKENLPGPPLEKVCCSQCGEYVTDSRHIIKETAVLCKACAQGAYYLTV